MSNPRPRPKVMMLTEAAAERIKAIMAAKGTNKQEPLDEVVEDKGARVLVDPKAILYLLGTEMDYRVDRLEVRVQQPEPEERVWVRGVYRSRAGREREALGIEILSARLAVQSWQRDPKEVGLSKSCGDPISRTR
jgi:iron-sulfur cluster assembly protein